MNKIKVNIGHLMACFNYDSDTGNLIWNERPELHFKNKNIYKAWNTRFSGKVAGSINSDGYVCVKIDGTLYLAHRLGYALYHGYFPENEIDHKDRVRHHNWIDNLKEVTHRCNMRNKTTYANNESGVTGVGKHKQSGKWRARITPDKKTVYLGLHKNFSDAVKARWEAEKKYKFPSCNTSSSAYNHLKQNSLI